MRRAVALLLCLLAAGPARAEEWLSPNGRDHPLAGRLWDVGAERWIGRAEAEARAARADFVLLGEIHGNADHHRLQAAMLRAMVAAGVRPAVAWEMIPEGLQGRIDAYRGDAAGFGPALAWEERGWPDWTLYRPIAAVALAARLPQVAADLDRRTVRAVFEAGPAALGAARARRLGLDGPLPAAVRRSMRAEQARAHCDLMPPEALDPMVAVQRARDAVLAENLARAAAASPDGKAVLITGNGHARTDRGAPATLARLAPGADILSIAFMPVVDDRSTPASHGEPFDGALPFDLIWFTARGPDVDHCARLRARMRRDD